MKDRFSKTLFKVCLLAIGVALLVKIFVYWAVNPELTEMQMLLKWWHLNFLALGCLWGGMYL